MPDAITERWTRSDADRAAVANGCWFSERRATHAVRFFEEQLVHVKAWHGGRAGQPFLLMPWQRDDVIMPLFGWMRADGSRRYRRAYIEVPKKNGKSPLCSGIGLYLFGADGEDGSQVFCAASDRDQAGIVFNDASAMAKASPLLRDWIIPRDSRKVLAMPSTNSVLKALCAVGFRNEGLNGSVLFDELHAQQNREFWDSLYYAGRSRRQPLHVAITTAGWDRNSIGYEQHDYASRVISGEIEDESFFAYIRAADRNDDFEDPRVWAKANPSLGVTVMREDIEHDWKEAKLFPAKMNSFLRYTLDVWTEIATRRINLDQWSACSTGDLNPKELIGRSCYGGLDLGESEDLSALVLVFPWDDGRRVFLPFFWVPGESLEERSRKHHVSYSAWERAGLLESTKARTTDYRRIRECLRSLRAIYDIQDIAFDPREARQLVTELAEDGFSMVEFPQTMMNFAGPTKEFLRLITEGKLEHMQNPVLRWMAGNMETISDPSGNERPNKDRKREKIDGIVAAIMGLGRLMVAGESVGASGILCAIDLRDEKK